MWFICKRIVMRALWFRLNLGISLALSYTRIYSYLKSVNVLCMLCVWHELNTLAITFTQHRPYYFNSMIYTENPSILTTRTLYKYHIHHIFKRIYTDFERCNMIAPHTYIYKYYLNKPKAKTSLRQMMKTFLVKPL